MTDCVRCVITIIHIKMNLIAILITELQTFFKSKINKLTSVWLWNVSQRSNMNRFLNSLGMISYTLSILFFPLKPIVKKLFSIKMSIDSLNCNRRNIVHRKLAQTNLKKDLLGIMNFITTSITDILSPK
jgi:hypothetical protein